jgi:curved DNA-binding protein CbpA
VFKNPFEVFGLTPDLVAGLSEKELFTVIKTMYRTLLKTFHPDISPGSQDGGNRSVELNLAFDSLNLEKNQTSFRKYRKTYIARRPSSLQKTALILKDQLKFQTDHEDVMAENFLSYLAGNSQSTTEETGNNNFMAFLPAKNIRLGLLDVAINNNLRQASWLLGSNYKEIEIDNEGNLSVKPVGRRRFSRSNYIHILGCVPVNTLDVTQFLEKTNSQFFKYPALGPNQNINTPRVSVLNLISRDNFKRHVLSVLLPVLLERAYLFSLNKAEYGSSGLISLEGIIVKFDHL